MLVIAMTTQSPTRVHGFLLAAAMAVCCLACAFGQDCFPFVIPGDDASPSITNLSHLSPKPAGAEGFVQIVDGHMATDGAAGHRPRRSPAVAL